MAKKKMTIPKRLEELNNEICILGGDAILLYSNEHEDEASAHCSSCDIENIVPLVAFFLHNQPMLIPKFIKACALAMEMPDVEKSDGDEDDDGKDDSSNPLLDNMPMN